MRRSVLISILGFVVGAIPVAAQSGQDLRVQAETAIRDGRPAEAVRLLESAVQGGTAEPLSRLIYAVALIADGRVELAEPQIALLASGGGVTPAQLVILTASMERVKAARAVSARIAPMVQRGDVRSALRTLESSAAKDPGTVFARSFLLRSLGEFDGAAEVLNTAANDPSPSAPQFKEALAGLAEQRAAFKEATEAFERGALRSEMGPGGMCITGNAQTQSVCHREMIEGAGRAAQTLVELAPFSSTAVSARLTQAIWLGKTEDALSIVRQSRLNHDTLTLPSFIDEDVWARGHVLFDFKAKELEWVGKIEYSNGKRQLPSGRIPFAKITEFEQELEVLNSRSPITVMNSVGFKAKVGLLGGVAHSRLFGESFGEVPLRLAMRTYGRVVAECLSLPANKYSLVDETPKRGGFMTGMAFAAVAGLAASQGNTAAATQASQNASSLFEKRASEMARDAAQRQAWQNEMSDVRLAVDARVAQAEVTSLLDGSLIPAGERRGAATPPAVSEPAPVRDVAAQVPAAPLPMPANASDWIARLEGTWRAEPENEPVTGALATITDPGMTLVLRVGGEGLLGALRSSQTYTGSAGFIGRRASVRYEMQIELTVNMSGRAPVGTMLNARFYEQGQLVSGNLVSLEVFEINGDEIEIVLEHAIPGTSGTVKINRTLRR